MNFNFLNKNWFKVFLFSIGFIIIGSVNGQSDCLSPSRVEVLPIFFVPKGGTYPKQAQKDSLMHYLTWAQSRYFELLKNRSTFNIADSAPQVYTGTRNNAFYQGQTDGGASVYTDELLSYYGYTRFNCPYIFVIVYMSPTNSFPAGGGRPLNGGINTGAGIVILSSYDLDRTPNFESTLQHELGHSFGLPHVNVYGYDMNTNESIMSYNLNHHTNYFTPSAKPGILIPENLRDLSLNKFVFPKMYFDSTLDIAKNYMMYPDIIYFGMMNIPNQTDYGLRVFTSSGETYGTYVKNIVQNRIKPSNLTASTSFDLNTMWQSGIVSWAEVEVHFPIKVSLDKIGIHSQHSGKYHEADSIKIEIYNNGKYSLVTLKDLTLVDQYVGFNVATDSVWKFSFKAGPSKYVTIRGLEFFSNSDILFPSLVPYSIENPYYNLLPSRPELIKPLDHFISKISTINMNWTCNKALKYRIQIDTTKDFCSPLVDVTVLSNNYKYLIPLEHNNYFWRVIGLNNTGQGFGLWSEIRMFESDMFTNINIQDSDNIFSVYPSIAHDYIICDTKILHGAYFIYTSDGRYLSSSVYFKGDRISVKDLMDGIYIIGIRDSNGNIFTSKFEKH